MPPSPSLLAYLPTIPTPPHYGTFASLSACTLLSLLCTGRLPRHPLLVIAWGGGTYFANTYWLELKIKQVTATVVSIPQIDMTKTRWVDSVCASRSSK
jgi:hypothetical protein